MRIPAVTLHLIILCFLLLLFKGCIGGEESHSHIPVKNTSHSRVYIKAEGPRWSGAALLGLADVYGVPLAIESSDFAARGILQGEKMLASFSFDASDIDGGMERFLGKINALANADVYAVTALTNERQRWGPPHQILSRRLTPSLLALAGEFMLLSVVSDSMIQPGDGINIIAPDQVVMQIPRFEQDENPSYLDLLQRLSEDEKRRHQINVSWHLLPWLRHDGSGDIFFRRVGYRHDGIGNFIDHSLEGSRWICRVNTYHPMLGAFELTQAMNESQVDFYVYSLPEAVNKGDDIARPWAPGVQFGSEGHGEVTSLSKWSIYAAGLATGDSLSRMLDAARIIIPQIARTKLASGNEVRINHSPDFFNVPYHTGEESVSAGREEFLVANLRRHWPEIALNIGEISAIPFDQGSVLDVSKVRTVRDMLVQMVPAEMRGTWAIIQDIDRSYTLSFTPMGAMIDL